MSWKPTPHYLITGYAGEFSTTEKATGYDEAVEKRDAMRKRGAYAVIWLREVR